MELSHANQTLYLILRKKLLQPQIDHLLLSLRRQHTVMRASVLLETTCIGVCVRDVRSSILTLIELRG